MPIFLFIFGAAIGSFLNVVSLRYDPEKFLFGKQINGRSACPHCGKKLSWYELIPLLSFILQRGRCRNCRGRISLEYPLVEILSGLIFVFVPAALAPTYKLLLISPINPINPINPIGLTMSFLWILIFATLLLVSLIDLRLKIIPDEANIFIFTVGAAVALAAYFGAEIGLPARAGVSFFEPYAAIFGFHENILLNRLVAIAAAALIFGFLIAITRGLGMGMGDLKLSVALAAIFGWPDIVLISAIAFVVGSLAGGYLIFTRGGGMKSTVPFGPFLALASLIAFFWGGDILGYYFGLFSVS